MNNQVRKILAILRAHWFIVISAAIMAILVMSPIIVFPFLAGTDYRGINIGHSSEDDFFYFARGKEVLEGHALGNPYFREGKDSQAIHHSIIEQLLVRPLVWLGVESGHTLVTYYYFAMGMGIFLLIVLIYTLVWMLSHNKLLAATAALCVVGGHYFVAYNKLKTPFSSFSFDLNPYQRPTFPIWSSVPFFIFLNFLVKGLKSHWKYLLAAGVVFGALFYIYFFAWSFALALLGCLWLVALARRDYAGVKKITAVALLGIAIGLYNVITMYRFNESTAGRLSLFMSHQIKSYAHFYKISGLSMVIAALFGWFVYKRRNDPYWPLWLAIILTSWVVLNTQLITGREILDFHYSRYFVYPLVIIMGLYMLWSLIQNPRYQRIMLVGLLILIYTDTAARAYRGTRATFEIKKYAQQYSPIIDYLNTQKPSVVLGSDLFYSDVVVVYTQSDLLWSEMAYMYVFPMERLEDVINVYYYMDLEGRRNFTNFVYALRKKRTSDASPVRYHPIYELSSYTIKNEGVSELNLSQVSNLYNLYRYIEGYRLIFQSPLYTTIKTLNQLEAIVTEAERKEVVTSLSKRFQEVATPIKIMDILKKYGVQYIIWDAVRQPEWDLSTLPGLKELLVSNNIHLYQVTY